MVQVSAIVFLLGSILAGLVLMDLADIGSYSMPLSYYMLLPAIVSIDALIEKISLKDLLISLVSISVIVLFGSRGALLCILVFIFIKIIQKSLNSLKTGIVFLISGIGLIMSWPLIRNGIKQFDMFLMARDIHSRTIKLFLRDGLYLTGRDRIYSQIFEATRAKPFLGIGLAADRRILKGSSAYAHNIFLELLMNYGFVLGLLVSFLLVLLLVRALFSRNSDKKNMLAIWTGIGFIHLQISSSYLIDLKFWIFLGLLIEANQKVIGNMIKQVRKSLQRLQKPLVFLGLRTRYFSLSLVNRAIPKSAELIFIADKRLRKDNAWAFAEFLAQDERFRSLTVYYYTSKKLEQKKNIIYISNPFKALAKQLRAKTIIYSYTDVNTFSASGGQKIINTMHGSPLKNIGYLKGSSRFKRLWRYEDDFTHILCMSDFFKKIVQRCYAAKEAQCLILGYPRNDYIFQEDRVLDKLGIKIGDYKQRILWMPTWRQKASNNINQESNIAFPLLTEENISELQAYLFKNKTLLIIKPHPIQASLAIFEKKYANIMILQNHDLDKVDVNLYQLFGEITALLTDYSSVYFDFLLTLKPIGFTIDDYNSYGSKRGFVVEDPLSLMPGMKLFQFADLMTFLENTKDGIDNFAAERKQVNDLVNHYQDGNSSQRIADFLGF
ncbi:MAG: hypothetical protein GX846_08915 [Deltaproteobacteria bacterium]|nr:hypothetical protein [Deltaproteobacteria bacterium]